MGGPMMSVNEPPLPSTVPSLISCCLVECSSLLVTIQE